MSKHLLIALSALQSPGSCLRAPAGVGVLGSWLHVQLPLEMEDVEDNLPCVQFSVGAAQDQVSGTLPG